MMMFLTCMRCGLDAVPVTVFFSIGFRDTVTCHRCEFEHYLAIRRVDDHIEVVYNPYTRRYPLDSYDEGDPEVVVLKGVSSDANFDLPGGPGPICIYTRKRRYSKKEVQIIWESSEGKCHLCRKRWQLDQRGIYGWHIDHVIPHAGGGKDTEEITNLKVACAKCNLKKGRGYTQQQLTSSIGRFIEWLEQRETRIQRAKNFSVEN